MPIVLKSGNLKFLEHSGPVQACHGIALPLRYQPPLGLHCVYKEIFTLTPKFIQKEFSKIVCETRPMEVRIVLDALSVAGPKCVFSACCHTNFFQ